MKGFLLAASIVCTLSAFGQLPGTDIYLLNLGDDQKSVPINISTHPGYDNQPSFTPDGKQVLFTSERGNNETDIYAYDIASAQIIQVTNTPEGEYSPEITPDGNHLSVVRVESGNDSIQRMWQFKKDGTDPQLLESKIKNVGYYGRIDEKRIALWLLPEPPALILSDIKTQDSLWIAANPGRCIKKIPNENAFSYLVKDKDSTYSIYRYDLATNVSSLITVVPAVSEDYAWRNDGTLCMARNSALYYYDYPGTKQWRQWIDLHYYNIGKIYRLTFSPDGSRLAFVAEEK